MSREAFESEKQKIIAQAAFQVFAEHGFRKTSMQLIAQKAGMSRPALYQHFQSKEDVFRHLAIGYLTKVAASIEAALARSGPPEQVLLAVFEAFDPDGMKAILFDAPHGDELMAINEAAVREEAAKTAQRICLSLCNWLSQEAGAGRIVCPDPEVTAQTIISSYEGLKAPRPSYADYKARRAALAQLLGAGLRGQHR